MFSQKKIKAVAVGVVTIAAVLVAAGAASAVTQTNGSTGAAYFYGTGGVTNNSTVVPWTTFNTASSSPSSADGVFTCSGTATGAYAFISLASRSNSATTPASWEGAKLIRTLTTDKNVANTNISPSSFNLGTAPTGPKSSGGNYYLGIACTNTNGTVVEAAYYRTVAVTATSGAYQTTDTPATNQFRVGTQPVSQTVAAGSNVTFTAAYAGNEPTAGTNIKWQKAESSANTVFTDVANAITGTLVVNAVTVADDSGDIYKALVSNDNGATFISSDPATLTVSETTGSVDMSATTVAPVEGTLSLSVPAQASVTFNAATLVNNYSTSTGTLPNVTINDNRYQGKQGWDLKADLTNFSYLTNTINKSQLGLVPAFVSATANGTAAGVTQTAGSAVYPATIASGTPANIVGNTVINAGMTLVAPRDVAPGTYTSKMTLTLTSK